MDNDIEMFERALSAWQAAEEESICKRFDAENEFSQALLDSNGANESQRQAMAKLSSATARLHADLCSVEAKAKFQMMLFTKWKLCKLGVFAESKSSDPNE